MKNNEITIIGGGVMSLTLAVIISEIFPNQKIFLIEKLKKCGLESSKGLNNAGTGHAGYCELNYTPINSRGNIKINNAIEINEMFEQSLQFWSYLSIKYKIFNVNSFLNKTPHISFVWGKDNVNFLQKRFLKMTKRPLFEDMIFSKDPQEIKRWAPLLIEGRENLTDIAATKVNHGTDIDFGELCIQLLKVLKKNKNFTLLLNCEVNEIIKDAKNFYKISYKKFDKKNQTIKSKKVFIGAGGMAIDLLQKTKIQNIKGYAGYPLDGEWLICKNKYIVDKYRAKVYSNAFPGAPTMSIPHLDHRVIGNHKILLFGPFASFTTKFLNNSSKFDFFRSIKLNNLRTLFIIFLKNIPLLIYLVKQSLLTHKGKMNYLKYFYPDANSKDWVNLKAGKRVQIIKKSKENKVSIEFGTEIIYSSKKNLAGLIGASPGASVSCSVMLNVISNFYKKESLQKKIKKIVPSYGLSLNSNPKIMREIRKKVYKNLKLK